MMFRLVFIFLLISYENIVGFSQPERKMTDIYKNPALVPVHHKSLRNVIDTVQFPTFGDECAIEFVTVGLNSWGRVSGMNAFGDLEKAQRLEFRGSENDIIVGALVFFEKPAIVGNGVVNCKIYSVDASTGGPLAIKGFSSAIKMNEIIFSDSVAIATPFSFESGVEVNLSEPEFFVSVDLSNLYASQDTLVILQTIPECGDGANTWELHNDGISWHPINSSFSWELNSDFIIAAVVDFNDPTSVDDFISTGDFRLHPAFPNPGSEKIRLNYSLKKAANLKINIYDQSGKLVSNFDLGPMDVGRHGFDINTSMYSTGNYLYRIYSANRSITSRFTVNR